MPDITLEAIEKNYGVGSANAVQKMDLTIQDGDFMCLLGPSGCGKTTTLRMIAGLEHPTRGSLTVGDRVFADTHDGIYIPTEQRDIGLVFQNYALWPHLSVRDNVDFGLKLRKVPRAERGSRVESVMEAMSITRFASRYPAELSGGQQQRVALARALAINPDVLLLDEPLSNLDASLRLEMRAVLKQIHEEYGTTIVFVTHDQWEAMTLATKIAVMSEGELQQVGTPMEVYNTPKNRFVAEFVGASPINILPTSPMAVSSLLSQMREAATGRSDTDIEAFGIRPEAILLDQRTDPEFVSFTATIKDVMPTGGSWIIQLDADDHDLTAVTTVPFTANKGSQVPVSIRSDQVHAFSAAGELIGAAA